MMTSAQLRPWVERFAATIGHRLGLRIDEPTALATVKRRAAARGLSEPAYLGRFDEPDELRALASELTVGETYFFRHREQLDAFVDLALPARLAAPRAVPELAILSAGCSTGEEPYTLAMLLHDHLPAGWRVALHAVDIDARALARAARGHYSRWSLRAMPIAAERRWFTADRDLRGAVLDAALRAQVAFSETNLAADSPLWTRTWDVVFCRNVLMYFTPAHADALLARIAGALAPGGYLFLGHAEMVWARGDRGPAAAAALAELETCNSHGTFYYRRRSGPSAIDAKASGPIVVDAAASLLVPSPAPSPAHASPPPPAPRAAPPISLRADGGDDALSRALLQLAAHGAGL